MASNSLAELLLRMKDRSVCFGWGAIFFLGRKQLNRLLSEQYLSYMNNSGYLVPFTSQPTPVYPEGLQTVQLRNLVLGGAVISFEESSLASPSVKVTMPILAGQYIDIDDPTFSAPALNSAFKITQDMGYTISFEVSLVEVSGVIDFAGRIMMQISDDPQAVCNLGESAAAQKVVTKLIMEYLAKQGSDWRRIELGRVDLSGAFPLSPTDIVIRTMQAPGDDPEEGAVVIFMKVKALQSARGTPIEGSGFEYCLPDDVVGGIQQFDAALLINHEVLPFMEENQLDTLKNMFFPTGNGFEEPPTPQRHRPHDMLVLGNITRDSTVMRITPQYVNLAAGKNQAFKAVDGKGNELTVAWTAEVPVNALAAGPITPNGLYTVPVKSEGYGEQLLTVVTARYDQGGVEQVQSARVIAQFESMMIKPRVCVRPISPSTQPVELVATTMSTAGVLRWEPLPPEQGTLEVIDNFRARYTPPQTITDPIERVNIVVTDVVTQETVMAVVVLHRLALKLKTNPTFLPSIVPGAPIPIEVVDYEPTDLRWKVLGPGEPHEKGDVVDGVFTAPTMPNSPIAVVQCATNAYGMSIIELVPEDRVAMSWVDLELFELTTPDDLTRCMANGGQQIPVRVEIMTRLVNVPGVGDFEIPLSEAELGSLRFVNSVSGAVIPYIEHNQEAIEFGGVNVAVNRTRNRFRTYTNVPTALDSAPAEPVTPTPRNNRTRFATVYFHLAIAGTQTFHAEIQDKFGAWWSSKDIKTGNMEVSLTGIAHTPDSDNYRFKIERVDADPLGRPFKATELYPDGDNMSGYRWSFDVWRWEYAREGRKVGFVHAFFEANVSMIQWESEQVAETLMTYTGFALTPAERPNIPNRPPSRLSFDPWLYSMFKHIGAGEIDPSFNKAGPPESGQIYIRMHRAYDVPFWYDEMAEGNPLLAFRARLDPDLTLVLIDEEANRHFAKVSFFPPSTEDSRNFLKVTKR